MKESSSSDRNNQQAPASAEADNPFIAFRRFADAQIASVLDTLLGVPSSSEHGSSHASCPALNGRSPQHTGEMGRWSAYASDTCDGRPEKIRTEGGGEDGEPFGASLSREIRRGNGPDDLRAVREAPPLSLASVFGALLGADDRLGARVVAEACHPLSEESLLEYLLCNPYSPLFLEQCEYPRAPRWREAFEDLLVARQGIEMPTQSLSGEREDGGDWFDFIQRLTKPDDWPGIPDEGRSRLSQLGSRFGGASDSHGSSDDYDGPETELDLYTRFLGDQDPGSISTSTTKSLASVATASSSESDRRPSIISTLTTTERIAAPDGTVHTKVVLKKRFADGREENSETVHTSQGRNANETQKNNKNDNEGSRVPDQKPQKERGWFWRG